MGTFGNTSETYVSQLDIRNWIRGSLFVMVAEVNQVADKITAFLKSSVSVTTVNIKCALYKHSDLSFVAETEERNIALTTTPTWYDFNFSTKPDLISSEPYIIVVWSNLGTGYTAQVLYNTGDANQGHHDVETYGTFPNTLVPSHTTDNLCIYCTYSAGIVAPTVTTQDATNIGRD